MTEIQRKLILVRISEGLSYRASTLLESFKHLANAVVQTLDNSIQQINYYLMDKWISVRETNCVIQWIVIYTGKKCIFQYGKSLENSMFEYPTLDNHWEIYSVPIKVQLFSNTGKMLFIHDLAAGVSLEVYWRTTHLVFQCWTMM